MRTYMYTARGGWVDAPREYALPDDLTDEEALGAWLFAFDFRLLAESPRGRCLVGHFQVWQQEEPGPDWPRYAVEIDQVGDACVVWIATLPDLWEFVAKYGGIGQAMAQLWPGDTGGPEEEDDEEACFEPTCPDCGEPMTWRPQSANDDEDGPRPGWQA